MKYKNPRDLKEVMDKREPISARVKMKARAVLQAAADKEGMTLSQLSGRVLEDYAEWLSQKR